MTLTSLKLMLMAQKKLQYYHDYFHQADYVLPHHFFFCLQNCKNVNNEFAQNV